MTDARKPEPPFTPIKATIIAGTRCPTCHQLPPAFDAAFGRWAETAWIDTSRKGSTHYTRGPDGEPLLYTPHDKEPPHYAVVVVLPHYYEGRWVLIKEEDDLDRARRADCKKDREPPEAPR